MTASKPSSSPRRATCGRCVGVGECQLWGRGQEDREVTPPVCHPRQALNNLQSTFSGFGFINSENVFKVPWLPPARWPGDDARGQVGGLGHWAHVGSGEWDSESMWPPSSFMGPLGSPPPLRKAALVAVVAVVVIALWSASCDRDPDAVCVTIPWS